MKKLFIAASFFATTLFSASAQDVQTTTTTTPAAPGPIISKRGYPILPEAGDWSLSIGASGAIRYFGNLLSSGGNNNSNPFDYPFQDSTLTQTLLIRKFVDANTAYRAIVGINFNSNTQKTLVPKAGSATDQVEDKTTRSGSLVNLGVGLEKRRGLSRVQGIYGAQAILGFGGTRTSYEYGNDLTAGSRTILNKQGLGIMFTVQAFGGVEYFFAPKMSLGGEFTWGPSIQIHGKGKTEVESNITGSKTTTTTETAGSSNIGLGLGNAFGTLRLNFYF